MSTSESKQKSEIQDAVNGCLKQFGKKMDELCTELKEKMNKLAGKSNPDQQNIWREIAEKSAVITSE